MGHGGLPLRPRGGEKVPPGRPARQSLAIGASGLGRLSGMLPPRSLRQAGPSASLLALALLASGCFSGASHPVTPQRPTIRSFTASPTSVAAGGAVTLSWSVTGAESLSIAP